jgi:hypothetical protein
MSGPGPNAAAVRKLIDRILDRWPNHKKTAAQLREYAADIRTLVERFGFNRVQAAADEARIRKSRVCKAQASGAGSELSRLQWEWLEERSRRRSQGDTVPLQGADRGHKARIRP